MLLALASPFTANPVREELTTPEYDNTDNPIDHALDYEGWEIAFEAYERYPLEALMLGVRIMMMKAFLLTEPPRIAEVIEGLDKALEVLFHHSQFHRMADEMFRKVAGGTLTYEEEEILKSLGLLPREPSASTP